MIISSDLYVSEKLKGKHKEYIKKIRNGEFVPGVFLIYKNPKTGRPEYMKSIYFMQTYMQTMYLVVLGITDNEKDALMFLVRNTLGPDIILDLDSD